MLGLPGSGRRELSRRLADMCDLPLVSAGDLLRLHAEKFPNGEAALALTSKTLETVPADSSQELVLDILKVNPYFSGFKVSGGWSAKHSVVVYACKRDAALKGTLGFDGCPQSSVYVAPDVSYCLPHLAILGCSGSGKSTQSRLISNRFGVVHVDVRKLLLQRAHEDEACRQALMELEAGLESSFEPMLGQLVADRLEAADCARRGWVLEGFPETAQQVDLLRQHRIAPDGIVFLEVPESSYTANVDSCGGANEARKDAARLVEMRLAQIKRWIPFVQQAFPDKFTTICADDAVAVESVAQRILEFLSRRASIRCFLILVPLFCPAFAHGFKLSAHPNASTLTCTSSTNNGAAGSAFLHRTSPSAAAAVPAASSEGEDAAATAASKVDVALVKKLRQLTTDFVSRSEVFTAAASRTAAAACMSACFAKEAAAAAGVPGAGTRTSQQQKLLQQLLSLPTGYSFPAGVPSDAEGEAAATVGADLAYTSRLVGETVVVKRVAMREALRGSGIVAFYCHQPVAANVAPLAVLLHLSYSRQEKQQEDQAEFEGHLRRFGKQLCMQIAAAKPLAVRVEDLPPAIVAQEQQYALSSLSSKGGSNAKCLTDAFKQKIVEGKMNKWHKEVVLLKQPWALDDSGRSTEKVLKDTEQLLKIKVSIDGFDLLEVASGSSATVAKDRRKIEVWPSSEGLSHAPASRGSCLLRSQEAFQKRKAALYEKLKTLEAAPRVVPKVVPVSPCRSLPSEATPSTEWQHIEKLLNASYKRDIHLFGVETHSRVPSRPFRFSSNIRKERKNGPSAFKAISKDPWDSVAPPPAGAPQFAQASERRGGDPSLKGSLDQREAWEIACNGEKRHTDIIRRPPKPLPNYTLGSLEFTPGIQCEGLEPFNALSLDEFLVGPGAAPLSPQQRQLFCSRALDFKEPTNLETRTNWWPHERERWRRSKRLRYLLRSGLVISRDEYLREQFAKDFRKYFNRHPKPHENPWNFEDALNRQELGSHLHRERIHYGWKELTGESRSNANGGQASKREEGGERETLPWSYHFEIEGPIGLPSEDTPKKMAYFTASKEGVTLSIAASAAACSAQIECFSWIIAASASLPLPHSVMVRKVCSSAILESSSPVLFRKEKHPKDITVPFRRLKAYGDMINRITSCRRLQDEARQELLSDWDFNTKGSSAVEHMPPPRGVRKNPNYELSSEKLQKAKDKLLQKNAGSEEDFSHVERRKRSSVVEPVRVLGGGRYAV
ncbi:elongation factor [Cyclospora cayetanensis]|uniref:Elongation factor Ts, mitochondrial n=1 Tax=Cyclospora cayetanensis TaxID=88456 RepID=A0A1D3D7L3_9EIME|nr:elongation factor [Cyclospora cayetanensis]